MLNNFIVKAMLKSQMKGLPQEFQDRFFSLIEKNPQLFVEIGSEMKLKMDGGMTQEQAVQNIISRRGDEMKALL